MDENDLVLFQVMATMASNTNDLFNSHEMEDKGGQSTDLTVGVWYVLGTMQATSTLFKTLTNFTLEEFDKLPSQVVLAIRAHVGSTCEFHLSYLMFQF
jgi:hypothetical protein